MAELPVANPPAYRTIPGNNLPAARIVWHTTESGSYPAASAAGVAANVEDYFRRTDCGGSAQYIVDVRDTLHDLPDNTIAWGAPPNPGSEHIEICGTRYYTRAQWLSPQVWPAVQNAIHVAAELTVRLTIPIVKLSPNDLVNGHHGHCGHVDVSQAWGQTDHTDPGPDFPWDLVIPALKVATGARAARTANTTGTYTVKGVQYAPGNPGFNAYLQHKLSITADGIWGAQTTAALIRFQTAHGLTGDAIIGAETARALGWNFTP